MLSRFLTQETCGKPIPLFATLPSEKSNLLRLGIKKIKIFCSALYFS